MENITLPAPDPNGIIPLSPGALSAENHGHKKSFGHFALIYDLAQKYWVRPRIHKADPRRHGEILSNMLKPFQTCRVLDVACEPVPRWPILIKAITIPAWICPIPC